MRVTPNMIYEQLSRALDKNYENLGRVHAQLSSGKMINKPSDDAVGLARALDYRVSINADTRYQRNISEASAQLEFVDTILTAVTENILNAKRVAVTAASGTLDEVTRAAVAQQAMQLRDSILNLGNSIFRDRYIFSGFRTDIPSFDAATYAYQGNAGVINAPIDRAVVIPVNLPGSDVFGHSLAGSDVVQISGGRYVHYTPGGGTLVQVEIRDTDDTTVLDTFSYSNVIQMTDILYTAIDTNDTARIEALIKPFDLIHRQVITVQAEVGSRLSRLDNQTEQLKASVLSMQTLLSKTEDADMTTAAVELNKIETTLRALLKSSAEVLSLSLFDFLR